MLDAVDGWRSEHPQGHAEAVGGLPIPCLRHKLHFIFLGLRMRRVGGLTSSWDVVNSKHMVCMEASHACDGTVFFVGLYFGLPSPMAACRATANEITANEIPF